MKNIRTILLLSATCLTIMGAETSFASLNRASLPSYTGSSATSTSICNTVTLSPKSNQKSHTHLVAESPSPHFSSLNSLQTQSEHRDSSAPISLAVTDASGGSPLMKIHNYLLISISYLGIIPTVEAVTLIPNALNGTIGITQSSYAQQLRLANVCFITDT